MATSEVPLLTDDTLAFGEEDTIDPSSYRHPYVVFFHLAFRITSIVTYLLCGWFSSSFIASFVFLVLLLSLDFWTVKNITGRLLVGLRWWNYVDDDGKSHWVYESRKGNSQNRIHAGEARIFWLGLTVVPLIWVIFFLVCLIGFSLKWMLLVSIALVLNGANLYGYVKCRFGTEKSLSSNVTDFLRRRVIQNVVTIVTKPSQPTTNAADATGVI